MRVWPQGGLWRHPDFLKLWGAETISVFGSQFTALALPLVAVLVLDASAFAVSALFVVTTLPFILLSLPAGVWVDRMRRKPILVWADLGRAAALATIPVAYVADALTLPHLYVVGFAVGVGTVFFDVSYQSYLPSLVPRDRLVEGNSQLELSRSASQLGGPGTAGGVVGAIGAPLAIVANVVSFVLSAILLFRIRKEERLPEPREGAPKPSMLREAKEGFGYVVRHPFLRPISICTGTSNFFWSMTGALLVVYAIRELRLSPALLGLAFSIGNAGPLLAALTVARIASRLGVGRTLLGTTVLFATAPIFYPLATERLAVFFLVAAGVLGGFSAVAYNITQVSFRQAITPERLQGRMNSVIRFLVWGTMPLGALLGGTLGTWLGLRPAMWIAAGGALLAILPIALSPVRKIRDMPEPLVEDALAETPLAEGILAPPSAAPAAPEP
ncbi:MAG TPA: MFS transporter [Gaiellaceae bacterium]|nr:MFS transporter [Gaiellaceae bacterium]